MMRFVINMCVLGALACCIAAPGVGNADDLDERPAGEDRAAAAIKINRQLAVKLEFFDATERTTKFQLVDVPLQQYTNPIAGEFYANLFIWTRQGRPAAAAAIAKWYAPRDALHLELHSLDLHPIAAELDGQKIWHPEAAGVTFKPVPGAGPPARAALARTREMRMLAREFRAHVVAPNRGEVDEDLRLLTKSVYRYKSEAAGVLDGAIFSFVRGTDPELLLLLEARKSGDRFAWTYAVAPLNSFGFHVYHREREVWKKPQIAPPWQNTRDPTKAYMVYLVPKET